MLPSDASETRKPLLLKVTAERRSAGQVGDTCPYVCSLDQALMWQLARPFFSKYCW